MPNQMVAKFTVEAPLHDALFQPVSLGTIECPNRVLMAPLTRGRSDPGSVPNAMIAEYYRQRAGAGLIISEATGISVEGLGWPAAPGSQLVGAVPPALTFGAIDHPVIGRSTDGA
jgi:2,4-dienoyl-CoA reductase-like NADH-dependent reductase (Old Yellow Enzyme family)